MAASKKGRHDIKGLPVGRRSRSTLVVGGVDRVDAALLREPDNNGTPIQIERYTIEPVRIREPLDGTVVLGPLYTHGARYHAARLRLDAAVRAGRAALDTLDAVGGYSPDLRVAMRVCADASDELDRVGTVLIGMVGLQTVASAAAAAAKALIDAVLLVRDRPPSGMTAHEAWSQAERELVAEDARIDERAARLRALGIPTKAVRPPARLRGPRAYLQVTSNHDRLYVATVEAAMPHAPGAIGSERIVQLGPPLGQPWSTVAWLAWRAAGRSESWDTVWDTWPVLEQFALETIGKARGVSADAVKKSRARNQSE